MRLIGAYFNPALIRSSWLIAITFTVISNCLALAKEDYFSYERVSSSLDDGTKRLNEISETSIDSSAPEGSAKRQLTKFVEPSGFVRHKNNEILADRDVRQEQSRADEPKMGQQLIALFQLSPAERIRFRSMPRDQMKKQFMALLVSNGGFPTMPRTVEPPAMSVDSPGRGSVSSRLASSLAKAFNVKQGYYSDTYNRLDRHEPLANIVAQPSKKLALDTTSQVKHRVAGQQQQQHQQKHY